jgi:hypothetical protein
MRFKRETATRVLMAFQDKAEKAADTIVKLMDSRNEIIKLKSSQETLDRAIGKVSQSFEVSGKDGGVIVVEFGEPIPPRSDG